MVRNVVDFLYLYGHFVSYIDLFAGRKLTDRRVKIYTKMTTMTKTTIVCPLSLRPLAKRGAGPATSERLYSVRAVGQAARRGTRGQNPDRQLVQPASLRQP
jgi:hypothetical protein